MSEICPQMGKDPASEGKFKLFLCSQRVTPSNLEITSITENKGEGAAAFD